jgi:hypothetical protein
VFQRAEIHRSCAWRCPSNQCFPRQPCACSDRARYLRSEVVEQAFFEIYHFFNTLNEHDKHVKHIVRNINIIGFKFRQAALREVPRSRYRGSGEQNCQFGNFWRRRTLCHAQAKVTHRLLSPADATDDTDERPEQREPRLVEIPQCGVSSGKLVGGRTHKFFPMTTTCGIVSVWWPASDRRARPPALSFEVWLRGMPYLSFVDTI